MAEKLALEKVSRMAPAELYRIAFGVRYEPQLKLLDRVGSVMDEVLRQDDTPFGPERFPVSETLPMQFRLLNQDNNSELLINAQDTILQMPLETRDASLVNDLGKDFDEYVLRPLRKIGGVKNILRYGVLFRFKETKAAALENPPISHYLSSDFPKANTLFMHFSRRLPAGEALVKKRVDDYRNVNYSIEQSETGTVGFSIDYQDYFQPMLDASEWDERPFSAFVDRGTGFVEAECQRWLKTFAVVPEVA